MNCSVITYIFSKMPEIPTREIFRYAGLRGEGNESVKSDILACLKEAYPQFSPKACYMRVPVSFDGEFVDFGVFKVKSKKLQINLKHCKEAFLFTATAGTGTDILINRYSAVKPVKALYFQAIGAAAVESICDFLCSSVFSEQLKKDEGLRPRFSPGYGDLDIACQKDFFSVLDCRRKIGVYLTEGGLMMPSKSVTAIAGISNIKESCKSGCETCEHRNECEFRE